MEFSRYPRIWYFKRNYKSRIYQLDYIEITYISMNIKLCLCLGKSHKKEGEKRAAHIFALLKNYMSATPTSLL